MRKPFIDNFNKKIYCANRLVRNKTNIKGKVIRVKNTHTHGALLIGKNFQSFEK